MATEGPSGLMGHPMLASIAWENDMAKAFSSSPTETSMTVSTSMERKRATVCRHSQMATGMRGPGSVGNHTA